MILCYNLTELLEQYLGFAEFLVKLSLVYCPLLSLWLLDVLEDQLNFNQIRNWDVLVKFKEVIIELSNDTKSDEVKYERMYSFCNIRQVPQVDDLDEEYHDIVQEAHHESDVRVLEVL